MSVQDRAQAQLSQLDKEVSALASSGHTCRNGSFCVFQRAPQIGTASSPAHCSVLTFACALCSCPSTPPSTTLRSRPPSPRSTPSSVSPASTSSSSFSTLPASSSSTSLASFCRATTHSMPCSAPARSMTPRYVPTSDCCQSAFLSSHTNSSLVAHGTQLHSPTRQND